MKLRVALAIVLAVGAAAVVQGTPVDPDMASEETNLGTDWSLFGGEKEEERSAKERFAFPMRTVPRYDQGPEHAYYDWNNPPPNWQELLDNWHVPKEEWERFGRDAWVYYSHRQNSDLNWSVMWRWSRCSKFMFRMKSISLPEERESFRYRDTPKWEWEPETLKIACHSAKAQSYQNVAGCYGDFSAKASDPVNWAPPTVKRDKDNRLELTWEKPLQFNFERSPDRAANAVECTVHSGGKLRATIRVGKNSFYPPYHQMNLIQMVPEWRAVDKSAAVLWGDTELAKWLTRPGERFLYPGHKQALKIDARLDCLVDPPVPPKPPPPVVSALRAPFWLVEDIMQSKIVEEVQKSSDPPPDFLQHSGCPLVLSHRGAGASFVAPENGAVNLPALVGHAAGIEVDIFYHPPSKQAYAIHDDNLERLLGFPGIFTSLSARKLKYVADNNDCQGMVTPVGDVLQQLKRLKMVADIELKPGDPREDPKLDEGVHGGTYAQLLGHAVGLAVRQYDLQDQVIISSFDPAKLVAVNEGFTGTPVRVAHATFKTLLSRGFAKWTKHFNSELKSGAHVYHYSLITKEKVEEHHKKGEPVGTYTLYDIEELPTEPSYKRETIKKLVDAGVDWIETDNPRKLRMTLKDLCPSITKEPAPRAFSQRRPDPETYKCPAPKDDRVVFKKGVAYRYGYCWYLGKGGQSCDNVCKAVGGINLSGAAIFETPDDCNKWFREKLPEGHIEPIDIIMKDMGNPARFTTQGLNGRDSMMVNRDLPTKSNLFAYGTQTTGGGVIGGEWYGKCSLAHEPHLSRENLGVDDPARQRTGNFPGHIFELKQSQFDYNRIWSDNSNLALLCPCVKPSRL